MFGKCGRQKLFFDQCIHVKIDQHYIEATFVCMHGVEAKWPHPSEKMAFSHPLTPTNMHNLERSRCIQFFSTFRSAISMQPIFFTLCVADKTTIHPLTHTRTHSHIWEINFHSNEKKKLFPILPSRFSHHSHQFSEKWKKNEAKCQFCHRQRLNVCH